MLTFHMIQMLSNTFKPKSKYIESGPKQGGVNPIPSTPQTFIKPSGQKPLRNN